MDTDTYDAKNEVLAVSNLENSRNRIAGPGEDRPDVRGGRPFTSDEQIT